MMQKHVEESRLYYHEGRQAMAKVDNIHKTGAQLIPEVLEVLKGIRLAIEKTLDEKDDRLITQAQALAGDGRIPIKSHLITVITICGFFGTLFIIGLMGMAYYTKENLQAELLGGRAEIKQHITDKVNEVEKEIEKGKTNE